MKTKLRIAAAFMALNLMIGAGAAHAEDFDNDTCKGPNGTVVTCCSSCSILCFCNQIT